MTSEEDDPGSEAPERRFPVVPGEPDDGERWPEEPDPPEFEPDEDATTAESVGSSSASSELRRTFWVLVIVVDVAVLAVAVGVMFVGFEGRWTLGGQLVLLGLVLGGFGWYRYRRYRRSMADSSDG